MEILKMDNYRWMIPKTGPMQVPGILYTDTEGLDSVQRDETFRQVANVASLPGIVKAAMAMPDIHWGYGFPIGGVAAFDWKDGVISPGGVGYDINCGVRLAATDLEEKDIRDRLAHISTALFQDIPTGVGSTGPVQLSASDEKKVLKQGSRWAVARGMGRPSDIEKTEDKGCMAGADPDVLSRRALERDASSWAPWDRATTSLRSVRSEKSLMKKQLALWVCPWIRSPFCFIPAPEAWDTRSAKTAWRR